MGVFAPQRRDAQIPPWMLGDRDRGLGWHTGGVPVTFDTALSLAAVWACVRLRADMVSSLPIDVYRKRPGLGAVPEEVTPIPAVLSTPAGNGVTIDEWLYASQVALDLRGNSYGLIVDRGRHGIPSQIELQHPDFVHPRINGLGELVYAVSLTGPVTATYGSGAPRATYPASEVWHERQFTSPGSLVGLSPIRQAAGVVGVPLAAERFGADWFEGGAHPSSILKNTNAPMVGSDQASAVKTRFREATRAREPVVMGSGWEWTQVQVSPEESQFLETMRWGVQQVCRLFGVPPEMIGAGSDGQSITYANVEQRGLHFLAYNMGPTLARRERALSRLTPSPQYVKLNAAALLRTDTLTRYQAHALGIRNHFQTPDEAREKEDLPPLTDEQKTGLAELLLPKENPTAPTAEVPT